MANTKTPPGFASPAGFREGRSQDGAFCALRGRARSGSWWGGKFSCRANRPHRPASCHAPPGHAGLIKRGCGYREGWPAILRADRGQLSQAVANIRARAFQTSDLNVGSL